MQPKGTIAITFCLLAAISTATAQAPAPAAKAPAATAQATNPAATPPPAPAASSPKLEMKPAVRASREAVVDADARGCLEFPSNQEIIRCAERYLPHRRAG